MDAARIANLLRSLSAAPSRRGAVGVLVGSALGGLLTMGAQPIAAKKRSKKKKKGRAQESPPPPPQGSSPPPPPTGPTCSDGVKNGLESDVDCGGTCPRCGIGFACNDRGDCESALCNTSATCFPCGSNADCPDDSYGDCVCVDQRCVRLVGGGVGVCDVDPDPCPPGTVICNDQAFPGQFICFKICGTP
jgi:hypothetical protein